MDFEIFYIKEEEKVPKTPAGLAEEEAIPQSSAVQYLRCRPCPATPCNRERQRG